MVTSIEAMSAFKRIPEIQNIPRLIMLGVDPRTLESRNYSPTSGFDTIYQQVNSYFLSIMNNDGEGCQYTNHFGDWIYPQNIAEIQNRFCDFIIFPFDLVRKRDVCRAITNIQLDSYKSLSNSPFFRTKWLIDLSIDEETHLGDGVVTFDSRVNSWLPSQIKGNYSSTSHLLIRQLK